MTNSRLRLAKAAGIVFVIGWLPLLIYIPFDAARGGGGNPIGLGLLMVAATFVAIGLLIAQAAVSMARYLRRDPI
jgi:hypothetical protein